MLGVGPEAPAETEPDIFSVRGSHGLPSVSLQLPFLFGYMAACVATAPAVLFAARVFRRMRSALDPIVCPRMEAAMVNTIAVLGMLTDFLSIAMNGTAAWTAAIRTECDADSLRSPYQGLIRHGSVLDDRSATQNDRSQNLDAIFHSPATITTSQSLTTAGSMLPTYIFDSIPNSFPARSV
jgi:hypothetical protein